MNKASTRRQRIIRALTPKKVRRAQARWRRRARKVANARAKVRSVWHGDVVVNGRRRAATNGARRKRSVAEAPARPASAPNKPAARRAVPKKAAPPPSPPKCDGTCTNSDMEPEEAKARGLCGMCCGRKELITNFGGKHVHASCSECDGSGLASVAKWKTAKRESRRSVAGHDNRPSRTEAASKAGGWFGLSALFGTLFMTFGWAWAGLAGAGSAAVGGAAYRHERKHGVSDHDTRTGRKAAKQAAREAGCSAACMWSIKPADTCHCPCGGATHGIAHKRKAAA